MDDQNNDKSSRIPTLTRENHEAWFRRMKIKLKGKGIFYTVEKNLQTHAWIVDPKAKAPRAATPSSTTTGSSEAAAAMGDALNSTLEKHGIDKLAEDFAKWGGSWNIDRKDAYVKAEAYALDIMLQSLDEEDQALIDEYETALGIWTALKVKYSKTHEFTANTYMTKIAQFEFNAELGLDGCWAKLKEYRRKLIGANKIMKNAYPDAALLLILTKSLPDTYRATTDGFRLHPSMPVEDKLKILYEVEEDDKAGKDESAHLARAGRAGKYVPPQRRRQDSTDSPNSDHSNRNHRNAPECYLCDKPHYMRDCPKLSTARRLLKRYDEERRKKKAIEKATNKPDSYNKGVLTKDMDKLVKLSKKSSTKKPRAYAANVESSSPADDSTDDSSEIEICALSTEELSKATPSIWPADTGASSHMSDQRSLFRFLNPIKPKRVKVGGGELRSDHMGDAELVCADGSSMLLADVLYVPKIGVNLLSVRRLCQAGLRFSGDENNLYLKDGKRKIVKAKMQNGLYVVSHIAKGYKEMAFPSMELDNVTTTAQISPIDEVATNDENSDDEAIKKSDKERYLKYHRRFAHLGPDKIRNLHKVTTLKKKIKVPLNLDICEVCALTKLRNKIPKELSVWSKMILGRIQFDVAGPFPSTIRGNQWFLLIIDICTRRDWVIPLKHKGDAYEALKVWKIGVEHQTNKKIKSARSDNAPELLKAIEDWRTEDGVEAQSTTIASSHQNGPAERTIQTVENDMRAMLEETQLPIEFWDEAAEADSYMRNRTDTGPIIDGQKTSPIRAFTGETPGIDHIRKWGSKCYYFVDRKTIPAGERHDKLVNPGRVGVFMGYSDKTTKHFKVYSPERGSTIVASVVKIDETVKGGTMDLRIRNSKSGPQGTKNVMLDRNPRGRPKGSTTKNKVIIPSFIPPPDVPTFIEQDMLDVDEPIVEPTVRPIAKAKRSQRANPKNKSVSTTPTTLMPLPQPIVEDALVENQSDNSTREQMKGPSKEMPRYFTRGSNRKRADSDIAEEEHDAKRARAMITQLLSNDDEIDIDELKDLLGEEFETAFPAEIIAGIHIPRTYKEAINDPKYRKIWKAAMAEEMLSLHANETFREVVAPTSSNIVSCKWVFTIKTFTDGSIERFKARLVARGFSQVHGEDYSQTFAPTVRMDTLRLFLATVAAEDLECSQFDIKNAFTESHLKETIYLEPPKGIPIKKGHVWQALRSLYGLKQAARDWNCLIKKELLQWGFVQSLADPCMFTHSKNSVKLLVYVDDIVAAARKQGEIDWFYNKLSERFNTKNLGEISKILGARVTRDRKNHVLEIDQEQYLTSVLDKFGITKEVHKGKKIPAADYENLRPATKNDTRINVTEYQQGIGSLMYAMVFTRPDIAFVLGKLSQCMSDPAEHHGQALKYLFRYLKSTVKQRIRYGPGGDYKYFVVYSDADWANDKVDRKSISGSITMFYGGPISWSSKKQRSVATSSCESEYIALATCAKQGQWIAQIFRDLNLSKYIGKNPRLVQMFGDNQGAIALTQNAHLNDRSKHVDICYHFIRDLTEKEHLKVDYIPTADMTADGMTKPLQRVKFEKFKAQMGLVIAE
jgi:hypothetical protein